MRVFCFLVGFPYSCSSPHRTTRLVQVRGLLQDIDKAEARLEQGKMKDKVLFHCVTRRYLKVLKKEWEKAEKAKADAKKAAGKSKKKAGVP